MTGTEDPAAAAATGPGDLVCPDCDARVKPIDAKCWLCGGVLPARDKVIQTETVASADPPSPFGPGWSPRASSSGGHVQFSLESLFLVTTLVAVCLGALVASPPLGVLALIVAAPALIRTLMEGHYARGAGLPLTTGDKIMAFLASVGVTIAALVAAFGAFFTACTGSFLGLMALDGVSGGNMMQGPTGNLLLWGCVALTLLATVGAFGGMWWMLRPRRKA